VTQPATTSRGGRPRSNPRRITVRDVQRLSPAMRRITFAGDELATFVWPGPAAHVKLIFPEPGSHVLPSYAPDGPRPATMRTYTPRRFDPATNEIEIDFVLHGAGPGSTWAAQATAGQDLILLGPGRGYVVEPAAPWYAIAVDATALPATETLLEAIPPEIPVTVFVEIAADDERRKLPRAGTGVHWLTATAEPGAALLDALGAFAFPAGYGRIYVGCEAHGMRRLRRMLLEERAVDASRVVTRGYWSTGEVNHPDHDYGDA
jgi:NADPH-dependent ferric siderophore reductase